MLLSKEENEDLRNQVIQYASKNGLTYIPDTSGTNINVQIIDTDKIDITKTQYSINNSIEHEDKPVLIIMDYAFGEQAYETIDELLKPYKIAKNKLFFYVHDNCSLLSV